MSGWLDQLLRTGLTLGLAAASYRYVENPIRRSGIRRVAITMWARVKREWRRLPPAPSVAGVAAVAALALVAGVVIVIGPAAPTPQAAAGATTGGRNLTLVPPAGHQPSPRVRGQIRLPKISAFGDSVLLGARHELAGIFPGGTVDAVESRQPDPILADVRNDARLGTLKPLVVIHIGNNGLIKPDDLERTLEGLSPIRLVIVVNDHLNSADSQWQKPNNAVISRIVPQFPNARVLDWDKIAGHHRDWLYDDDLHLRPDGATGYAQLIASTYRSALANR